MANYGTFNGEDAKVRSRSDGGHDIYHGGRGRADGPGHGHIVTDSSDSCRYWREPDRPHTSHVIDDRKGIYDHTLI